MPCFLYIEQLLIFCKIKYFSSESLLTLTENICIKIMIDTLFKDVKEKLTECNEIPQRVKDILKKVVELFYIN